MLDGRILASTHDLMPTLWHHDQLMHSIVVTVEAHWFNAATSRRRYDSTTHLTIPRGGDYIQTAGAIDEFRLEYIIAVARFKAMPWLAIGPVPHMDGEIIGSGADEITETIEIQAINTARMATHHLQ